MATIATTPIVPPFRREAITTVDSRIGNGVVNGKAVLPLFPGCKRIWLDTNTKADGDGKSAATPHRAEAVAYGRILPGDQLMIAGGSRLGSRLPPVVSGLSAAFPTVVQSYDRSRPDDATRYGSLSNKVAYRAAVPFITGPKRGRGEFFALRGIKFDHDLEQPAVGYSFGYGVNGLLIEQCSFVAAQLNLNTADLTQVRTIRQCSFVGQFKVRNAAGNIPHAQGLYTSHCYDEVIEDCVFYHCGWKMGETRALPDDQGGPTIFNHAIYAAVQSGGTLRRCVFVRPSSHGAQLRGNWHSHNNVFIACPLALLHGGGSSYRLNAPDGVMALAYRNVVTIAESIDPEKPRGGGIEVANTRPGSVVEANLIAGSGAQPGKCALAANASEKEKPNPTAVAFRRNTNAWSNAGFDRGAGGRDGWPDRVTVDDIDNITPLDLVQFADPTRDGHTAAKALGFDTIDALGLAMVEKPGTAWAGKIASHMRAGFRPVQAAAAIAPKLTGAVRASGDWSA